MYVGEAVVDEARAALRPARAMVWVGVGGRESGVDVRWEDGRKMVELGRARDRKDRKLLVHFEVVRTRICVPWLQGSNSMAKAWQECGRRMAVEQQLQR